MFRATIVPLTFILVIIIAASSFAADTRTLSITKVDTSLTSDMKELRVKKQPMSERTRLVNPTGSMDWKVNGWVTGNELFKNYLDPSTACENPYPFTITEVNMPMYFARPTMIVVSIDIEDVYYSTPECPWPDSVLAISSDYQLNVAEPGLYNIWIPLDEPLVVNRPFFAGFFIGNTVDTTAGVAVITNNKASSTCRSFNIWDEQIGFVDLVNNGVWDFPGQLMLYAAGYPGGNQMKDEPEPSIAILSPCQGRPLFKETTIWAHESSGSRIIDHVDFEYTYSGETRAIGRDFDGSTTVRDGLEPSGSDGYSHIWNFAALEEGYYTIRAIAVDTLGRSVSDEVTVYLEPTPPTPKIIAPRATSSFCSTFDVLMRCADEDLDRINILHKEAQRNYSAGIRPINRLEYGEEYAAPVAVASAIHLWSDRGYFTLGDDNSFDVLVDDLAARFNTCENEGTSDEALYHGLLEYNADNDSAFEICNYTRPDYSTLRIQLEEEENAVILALGDSPGAWLTLEGFRGWSIDNDTYVITVANSFTGTIEALPLRDQPGGAEVRHGGKWYPVDRAITIGAVDWKVKREYVGEDADETDGWAYTVTTDELSPNSLHYIRAEATDKSGIKHYHTVILNYDCSEAYSAGDYDGDGVASIVDLAFLIDFVTEEGPEPVGGPMRADANGDSQLNITDLVYYLNYLYGSASPPSH